MQNALQKFVVAVAFISTAAATTLRAQELPAKPWDYEAAIIHMAADPDEAERVLSQGRDPFQRIDFALFLHAFRHDAANTPAVVATIFADIDALSIRHAIELDEASSIEVFGEPDPYNGGDDSLLEAFGSPARTFANARVHMSFLVRFWSNARFW